MSRGHESTELQKYLDLLSYILENGVEKPNRTDTPTLSVFGHQFRFDLNEGFPILTTKKIFFKGIVHELLWFLQGGTNVDYLQRNGVRFWDDWADENGDLGPIYGAQWRNWTTNQDQCIDQIAAVISELKDNPDSRRHIVSAWNVGEIHAMAIPPCHTMFQFYVAQGRLSCQLYQRSADVFLGVPFNIASYALLTSMIAQIVGLELGDFVHTFGDVHLYVNHVDKAKLQLERNPLALPRLSLNPDIKEIDAFRYEDIKLEGYKSYPAINAPIAV